MNNTTYQQWLHQNFNDPVDSKTGLLQLYQGRWVQLTKRSVSYIMPHQIYWTKVTRIETTLHPPELRLYSPVFVIETRVPMWADNDPNAHLNDQFSREINYTVRAGKFARKNPFFIQGHNIMPEPVKDDEWEAMLVLMSAAEVAKEGE